MAGFVETGVETGAGYAATRSVEKMPHNQPVPRSGMAQQSAGAVLKMITDIAGMLGPVVLIGDKGGSTAVGVGPGPAESATGPMEKMPQVPVSCRQAPGQILR